MLMFKEFTVKDVLNVEQTKSVVAKADLTEGNIPYVTRTISDNGYMGTCGNKDKVNKGNCITIGAETGVAFYQPNDFVAGNRVYRLSREGLDIKEYLFLASVLNVQKKNYSYSNARIPEKIKAEKILLPVIENSNPDHEYTVDDIDWQYMRDHIAELMRDRITELERYRIRALDTYLQVTGLNDYELTEDDKKILSLSAKRASDENGTLEDNSEDEVIIAPFELTELFIKKTIKGVPKKDEDLTENPNGYHIFGQNIKYQYEHKVLMDEKYLQTVESHKPILAYTSSVGEIGMIAESFYRTGDNGAFQGLFPLFDINEYAMRYILTVLQKHFADFGYATSMANIMSMKIYLPITSDGTPDFDYMERYIRAMEKVVIADAANICFRSGI
jgi:hypothetical protein